MRFEDACPTGNIMLDGFSEPREQQCECCDGDGSIDASFAEYNEYIMTLAFELDGNRPRHRAIKKQWRETGKVPCQKCEGTGYRRYW